MNDGETVGMDSTAAKHRELPGRYLRGADPEPLAVTPREACRLLSIGNTRLYELIAAKEIESYQEGRARRITMTSIRARITRLVADGGAS
jgi:excisionase family DNA binding protein